jgi:hypothetical protein
VFRGKLIRFYQTHKDWERVWLPRIEWEQNYPKMTVTPDYERTDLYGELGLMPVEAKILDISSGEVERQFQQALIPIAMEIKD